MSATRNSFLKDDSPDGFDSQHYSTIDPSSYSTSHLAMALNPTNHARPGQHIVGSPLAGHPVMTLSGSYGSPGSAFATLSGPDDTDLIDLNNMQSPDALHARLWTSAPAYDDTVPASIGFAPTPSQPIISPRYQHDLVGSPGGMLPFGSATGNPIDAGLLQAGVMSPVDSTSPFDQFMLQNNFKQINKMAQNNSATAVDSPSHLDAGLATTATDQAWLNNQQQQQQQVPKDPSTVKSPQGSQHSFVGSVPVPTTSDGRRTKLSSTSHAQRFLQGNAANASNTSSPVGSYGSATDIYPSAGFPSSPSTKPNALGTSPGLLGSKPMSVPRVGKSASSALSKSLDNESQSVLLAERRRRRRESHNAVERRRRDNINEKIQELATLVPESMLLAPDSYAQGSLNTGVLTKDGKPNKGTILTKSVEYIRQLQNVIDEQNRREAELQELVQSLQRRLGVTVTQFGKTSAELMLAKILGPQTETYDEPELVLTGPQGHVHVQSMDTDNNTKTRADGGQTADTQADAALLMNQLDIGTSSGRPGGTPLEFTPEYGDMGEYEQTADQFLVS